MNSVYHFVAPYLHVVGVVGSLLHFNRRDILKFIFSEGNLKNDQVGVISDRFDNPDEIDLTVSIQIEIVHADPGTVESPLKCLKILRILE